MTPTISRTCPSSTIEAAHHRAIGAVAALPECVAQHHDGRCARFGVAGGQGAANVRRHLEYGEERRGDGCSGDLFRAIRLLKRVAIVPDRRQCLERGGLRTPVEEVRRRDAVGACLLRPRGGRRRHHHQRVWIGIRQWPPEDRLHRAEDDRRAADPDREREDRGERESGAARQHADRLAGVAAGISKRHGLSSQPEGVLQRRGQPPRQPPAPERTIGGDRHPREVG